LHVGARYYEVETGRWVQKDLIYSFSNFYTYVLNNPINVVDPYGLWYVELSVGVGVIEVSIGFGTKVGGGLGWSVGVEFEIGWSVPVDVNISASMGDLEPGLFWEVDLYYWLGGEFGGVRGGGPIASIGLGTPAVEFGMGWVWVF
jgi:hypothetical protein